MISDFSKEVLKFYDSINKKNIVKSKLSYSIIMSLLKPGTMTFYPTDFEEILGKEVTEDNMVTNKNIIDYICDFFEYMAIEDKENAELCIKCIYSLLDDEKTIINMGDFITRIKNDLDKLELKENIKDNIDRAFYYGISVMNVSSESQIKIFEQIINEIPNITMVPFENNEKIALLNKNDKREKMNTYELFKQAGNEYYEKNYRDAINSYLTLLRNSKTKLAVCGRLGLSYMMIGNYDVAIDYLMFTTSMNVNHIEKYDYTSLIYKLENEEKSEDKKVQFKMFEEEFYDDMSNYYGIDCINDIINSVNSGFSIEDACKFMNLSDEQISLVYLIYARECYYNCDYRNGDNFIAFVQKSKNNPKYIKKIINTICVNKYYYKNRKRNEPNAKILKLGNK